MGIGKTRNLHGKCKLRFLVGLSQNYSFRFVQEL